MFAQVIQGRTKDPAAMWNRSEDWDRTLKPGAEGFLGSTAGVSDDGEVVVVHGRQCSTGWGSRAATYRI